MTVDLTPEELARILQWAEAMAPADQVNRSIRFKIMSCLENFRPPEYVHDPQEAAKKWQV